jgi:excisionase family DNA binding protein
MGTRQFRIGITLDEDGSQVLVELLTEALGQVQAQQPRSAPFDEKRAARPKASQNALFSGQEPPTDRGLLLNTRETARLLNVSARTVFTMEAEKRMPKAIRIGKAVRWSYEELKAWIAKGCPQQETS